MSILSRVSIAASILDFESKKFFNSLLRVISVAADGSVQADAVLLTGMKNVVTAANGAKGVILPPAAKDMSVEVVNTVANADLLVYPDGTDQINAITAGDPFTLVGGAGTTFFSDANKHWYVRAGNLTGTATTASSDELNVLDDASSTNDTTGKAAILGTNGALTLGGAVTAVGSFIIGSADMNEVDLEKLDGITNGAQAANKAVVADANVNTGVSKVTALHIGASGAETQVTATAAELNDSDRSLKSVVFDDFHGTWAIGDAGPADNWSTTAGGGTNTELATTVAAALNGAVTMKSATDDGANSANNTSFTGIGLAYKANQGGLAVEARLKIDDIVEAYVFVGFTDVISTTVESPISFTDGTNTLIADANDACGIVFTGDSTTQEFAHGGVKATTPTAGAFAGVAPVNGTYVVLRVEVSAAGAVQGFVNGTAIGSAIANAVTVTTALTPAVIVGNTAAAQTVMTLDYVKVEMNR